MKTIVEEKEGGARSEEKRVEIENEKKGKLRPSSG
jgi:hypothetical protein